MNPLTSVVRDWTRLLFCFAVLVTIGSLEHVVGTAQDTISALWSGAQADLQQGNHMDCARKFNALYTLFAANEDVADVATLKIQSLVNQAVCLQGLPEERGQAAHIYRQALQLSPGFAGAQSRLCELLTVDPSLAIIATEADEMCGLDAESAAARRKEREQCGAIFVSEGVASASSG